MVFVLRSFFCKTDIEMFMVAPTSWDKEDEAQGKLFYNPKSQPLVDMFISRSRQIIREKFGKLLERRCF